LFSLGQKTIDITFEYGARIDKIIPVGSLFMEESLQNRYSEKEKNIDVLMLGINTMNAYERLDKYTEFMDDYYSLYRWAAKLSVDKPEYNIVLIHHTSAGKDYIEEEDTYETIIEKKKQKMEQEDRLDMLYNELQMPILIMSLFLLFQLPFTQKKLFHFFPSMFHKDGNMSMGGYVLKTAIFGLSFYFIMKLSKYASEL
jgi:hypothetical protein